MMEAAFERKKEKCNELGAACTESGRKACTYPDEVRCFVGKSTQQLVKTARVTDSKQKVSTIKCNLIF